MSEKQKPKQFDAVSAAHSFLRAASDVGWDFSDPNRFQQFVKRLQHVEYGLDAQIEFASLLCWLGRCALVHELGQLPYSSNQNRITNTSQKWRIPDLFASFELEGQTVQALIEVKTNEEDELVERVDYLESLQRYAALLGLPLLFAWRPRHFGLWMLFDARGGVRREDKIVYSLNDAMRENLMSCLAGDFMITPYSGFGLSLTLRREDAVIPDAIRSADRYVIVDAKWHDRSGNRIQVLSPGIYALWISCMENQSTILGDILHESFTSGEGFKFAQQIPRALFSMASPDEKIRWKNAMKEMSSIVSRDKVLSDLENAFGSFIHIIGDLQPVTWPDFIPRSWRSLTGRTYGPRS